MSSALPANDTTDIQDAVRLMARTDMLYNLTRYQSEPTDRRRALDEWTTLVPREIRNLVPRSEVKRQRYIPVLFS